MLRHGGRWKVLPEGYRHAEEFLQGVLIFGDGQTPHRRRAIRPALFGNVLEGRINPIHDLLSFLLARLTLLLFRRHLVGIQDIANRRPNFHVLV